MFVIKQNDTLPNLETQLIDCNNEPVNLDLCGIKLYMESRGIKVSKIAEVIDKTLGKIKVSWNREDTSNAGTYKAEIEVTMPDGKVITYPNDGYFTISIVADLGGE